MMTMTSLLNLWFDLHDHTLSNFENLCDIVTIQHLQKHAYIYFIVIQCKTLTFNGVPRLKHPITFMLIVGQLILKFWPSDTGMRMDL